MTLRRIAEALDDAEDDLDPNYQLTRLTLERLNAALARKTLEGWNDTGLQEDKRMNISIDHPTDKPNFSIVQLDDSSVAFSYNTPIGFATALGGWTTRENDWGPTTGKHLNWLDDDQGVTADRLDSDEFENQLAAFYIEG